MCVSLLGLVSSKCYSGGLGPTPNWDVGCLREECYHNKAAQSRALNKRKAPREGWLSKYRNSYVPPRTWALGIKTHPDQEIAIITGHCPQNRNQSPSKYAFDCYVDEALYAMYMYMRQLQMFQKVEYGGGPKVVLEC